MKYGFEYFCGANVIVSIGDMPVLEAAGISYEARDSKMPIYGYSSRHYDAVADGQVIVQGYILLNYVHQDYLFRAIELRNGSTTSAVNQEPIAGLEDVDFDFGGLAGDYAQAQQFITQMKQQYWNSQLQSGTFSPIVNSHNPFDVSGGVDITIAFGQQDASRPAGQTAALLVDVHFTGRSTEIKIDEDVIVEAHQFFARDVFSLRNRPPGMVINPEAVPGEQVFQN